jgi:hypothetical protein
MAKKIVYRKLTDPANADSLLKAMRKAAKVVANESLRSVREAFLIRLKGGQTAQVFVEVASFDEGLLTDVPLSGGLFHKYQEIQKAEMEKAKQKKAKKGKQS